MKIVTVEQMRELERRAVDAGVPEDSLMESAGLAVARRVTQLMDGVRGKRVVVLVGGGNNGGDGLVAARYLADWGALVTLYMTSPRRREDKFEACRARRVRIVEATDDPEQLELGSSVPLSDAVLDAVLGIGGEPPLGDSLRASFELLRSVKQAQPELRYVALDIPTGVGANGACDDASFRADLTLTLGAPKVGLYRFPGAAYAGLVEVLGIGLPDGAGAWLIAPLAPEEDHPSFAALRSIVERLYAPGGCPWDREQTHESLRQYLLEESYEVAEAIDEGDVSALREELGDLLVQILMHCAMAQEASEFTVEEVVRDASLKMIRRHPHVFGDESAQDAASLVAVRWDEIKAAERAARGEGGLGAALDAVPRAAPALLRAAALQGRAERAGASRPPAQPAERVREALEGAEAAGWAQAESRIGELLWAVVALGREHDIDAEAALRASAAAFVEQVAGQPRGDSVDRTDSAPASAGADATLPAQVRTGAPVGRPSKEQRSE